MARGKRKVVEAVVEVPAQVVSQADIQAIVEKRERMKDLKAQLKALDNALTIEEGNVIKKLDSGFVVEAGSFVATLDKHPGRCTVSWKDEAIALATAAGKDADAYEAEVKASHPPKMVTDLDIVKACHACGSEKEIK